MQLETFERSLADAAPPAGLSPLLTALWHERKGDWNKAHEIAQDIDSRDAARVHAYLHRREGDPANAAYWYRQASMPVERADMDEEWRTIVRTLLAETSS